MAYVSLTVTEMTSTFCTTMATLPMTTKPTMTPLLMSSDTRVMKTRITNRPMTMNTRSYPLTPRPIPQSLKEWGIQHLIATIATSASNDSEYESDNSTPLTTYVDALEAELDAEIADLDSIYDPAATDDKSTDHDLSNDFEPIDPDEIPQSAREQTAADMDARVDDNSDDSDSAYSDNQPKK
jgi:hypothetical protein